MHLNDPLPPSIGAPTPKLPPEFTPYLTLLSHPTALPICLICRAALLPKSLLDHLRKHHQLPVELRSALRSLVATLPAIDFDDVASNAEGSAPVSALQVYEAIQCKQCGFIRRDVTDVRKHVNQEHGASAAGAYEQVRAQTWFGGRRAVYWRVSEGVGEEKEDVVKEGNSEALDEEEEPVAPNNTQSLCRWGLFGKGFGDKTPRSWREVGKDTVYKLKF